MSVFFAARKGMVRCVLYAVLVCLCGFVLVSCQKEEKKMKDPKAALTKAAETYWQKRWLEKDYNATYAMEAAQGDLTLEDYKKRVQNKGQIDYLSIKITDVEVAGQNGKVKVVVNCQIQNVPKPVDLLMPDNWVIRENEWKHVQKKKK